MHPDQAQKIPQQGYGYVYHITVNNKNYIGISTTPWSRRWDKHKSPTSGCTKLVRQLAYARQHNLWDSIKVQFIQSARSQQLDRLQKYYIKKYASFHTFSGLNSTQGGRDTGPYNITKRKRAKRSTKHPAPVRSWDSV